MNTLPPQHRLVETDRRTREFALWMLGCLGIDVSNGTDSVYEGHLPDEMQQHFHTAELVFVVSPDHIDRLPFEHRGEQQVLFPGYTLFSSVVDALAEFRSVIHSEPVDQPQNIYQFGSTLLSYYHFEGGQIQFGGCTFEKRPVLRHSYLTKDSQDSLSRLRHLYCTTDGRVLDDEEIHSLGLSEVTPLDREPLRGADSKAGPWLKTANQSAERMRWLPTHNRLVASTVVWCQYAQGRLAFVTDKNRADVGFEGWAGMLADGSIRPPAFSCDATKKEGYQVAVTDDGTITVADALVTCDESGLRVLDDQLESCEVSGKRVLKRFMMTCPVGGQRIQRKSAQICETCQQLVSPDILRGKQCDACRRLQPVHKDDPRLGRILGEYPVLDRWHKWRISETSSVYVIVGLVVWRQILLVVNKETLEVKHLAESGRLSRGWSSIPVDRLTQNLI